MTQNEISAALRSVTGGQAFITATQLAKAMGRKNLAKVKNDYLKDLEAVNGKYFLITEISAVLKSKCE